MGISLDSLSITSAFNSILNFFKSQENNSKWKDLSAGSEGIFLIRMLANILSNISYRLVTARRENYITTANLLSSALGIALNLGYSAHRGTNQKRKIQFEANSDYVIPSHTVIGSYDGNYDVIYVGDIDPVTKLRKGLVLEGPLELEKIRSIDSLTKTIVVNTDITDDVKVGDLIDVEGTGSADGRYTIFSLNIKVINDNTYTYITTVEPLKGDYTADGTHDAYAIKITIQDFKIVIGKLKTITWVADTSKVQPFTRFEEGISEDYVLYLDGAEVPTSNIVRDLKDDMYLVRTNPYSSVDILYLNNIATAKHKYGSESVFTLKYVELADVEYQELEEKMSGYGKVTSTISISQYTPFEKIEDIKINAPVDHETQHLIRSKKDYTKRIKQVLPNIIETAYKAITPTYTLVSYLKDDCTLIDEKEIGEVRDVLIYENYFGAPLPDAMHPQREGINLGIRMFVTDKLVDSNDIRYDINNILKTNYAKLLNQTFDTYALERLIEQLSYVKWARVAFNYSEWVSRGSTDLGSIIKVGDTYYKADKILGVSGGTEPQWNIPIDTAPLNIDLDKNYETNDGGVIWRAYKRLDVEKIKKYECGTKYSIGDYVYTDTYPHFMFKCVDLLKSSGTSNIDTTTTENGDFIIDGELVWVCKEYSSSYPVRKAAYHYRLGDSANIGSKSFEVIGYIGKTGYISPTFEKAFYNVNGCVTPQQIKDFTLVENGYFELVGDQTSLFPIGSTMIAGKDNGEETPYKVLSRILKDGNTRVFVTTRIDTRSVPIETALPVGFGSTSIFTVRGNRLDMFKIGKIMKALGKKTDATHTVVGVSFDYNIINVRYVSSEDITEITIRDRLDPDVTYETLIEPGYTYLKSPLNNSFIIGGDVTAFFKPKSIIKAKTDEGVEMSYVVKSTEFDNLNKITYVLVTQEISKTNNYENLAPSWQGTEDGEIKWVIVEDINNITYEWNVYNDISYRMSVQY